MTKMEVQNVLQPGKTYRVDAAKYEAMRDAFLKALPHSEPGHTVAELKRIILQHLSPEHFPNGEKAGWWLKCVQLDLEAKGIAKRGPNAPVRLYKG